MIDTRYRNLVFSLPFLTALAAAPAAHTAEPAVLLTVNGAAVKRAQVQERVWKGYSDAVINEMVEEILVRQEAEALKVQPDAKEVNTRFKRIQDQFKDEATFKEKLAASGTSVTELRGRIEHQVLREALLIKAKDLKVSDEEVKDFFEANKERLGAPDSVRLRHLLVASEKEASDFLVALRAGADFGKLATEVSLDAASKAKGGDLGFISKGMLQPDLEKIVFGLKPGEVSAALNSREGFHIFKVEEIKAAKPAVFSEIKDDLKLALLADKVTKSWPGYSQELRGKAKIVTGANSKGEK